MLDKNPTLDNCLEGVASMTAAVTKICERSAQLNAATLHAFSQKNKEVLDALSKNESPEALMRLPLQMIHEYHQVFFQHCQQALDNFAEVYKISQSGINQFQNKDLDQAKAQPQKQNAKGSAEKVG